MCKLKWKCVLEHDTSAGEYTGFGDSLTWPCILALLFTRCVILGESLILNLLNSEMKIIRPFKSAMIIRNHIYKAFGAIAHT